MSGKAEFIRVSSEFLSGFTRMCIRVIILITGFSNRISLNHKTIDCRQLYQKLKKVQNCNIERIIDTPGYICSNFRSSRRDWGPLELTELWKHYRTRRNNRRVDIKTMLVTTTKYIWELIVCMYVHMVNLRTFIRSK